MMMRYTSGLFALVIFTVSSCAWQRVEQPPAYIAERIPITIGLEPSESAIATGLAPDLASELKTIGEFEEIIYPYRPGDTVDCLLKFDATGTVEGHGVGAGIAAGLTFGLAGLVVGPSTVVKYDIDFHLTNGTTEVARNKVHVDSKAEFGVFADATEVANKQAALLIRKAAISIAERIEVERPSVIETCSGYEAA